MFILMEPYHLYCCFKWLNFRQFVLNNLFKRDWDWQSITGQICVGQGSKGKLKSLKTMGRALKEVAIKLQVSTVPLSSISLTLSHSLLLPLPHTLLHTFVHHWVVQNIPSTFFLKIFYNWLFPHYAPFISINSQSINTYSYSK